MLNSKIKALILLQKIFTDTKIKPLSLDSESKNKKPVIERKTTAIAGDKHSETLIAYKTV